MRKPVLGTRLHRMQGLLFAEQVGDAGESSYFLSVNRVTQKMYAAVAGQNPSILVCDDNAVNFVNWFDAVSFCEKLSQISGEGPSMWKYRLPSEQEWCHGVANATIRRSSADPADIEDSKSKFRIPHGDTGCCDELKYVENMGFWEWCQDWDGLSGHGKEPGEEQLSRRAVRGASWLYPTELFPFPSRLTVHPSDRSVDIGFRVVAEKIN